MKIPDPQNLIISSTNPSIAELNGDKTFTEQEITDESLFYINIKQGSFVPIRSRDDFEITNTIGCGAYGTVKLATDKKTGEQVAAKEINDKKTLKKQHKFHY